MRLTILLLALAAVAAPASAGEWPAWRGPTGDGVALDQGLVTHWSPAGENVIWKADGILRSTPVVIGGQVCVIGRTPPGTVKQEYVACFDAQNGRKNWEHRFNVYHSTVPYTRVGWASLAADPETGNIYAHGVAGQLNAYDPAGKLIWSRFLTEEFGHFSGYGGRTQTPIVDGDHVVLGFVSSGWGDQAPLRHRYFAFDKRTGDVVWVAAPGGPPQDFNTQSAPVAADVTGQRLIVAGDADGAVHAMKAATGEPVWSFQLSKIALNGTPVVAGDRVYIAHGEENVDESSMGRVVAIDATGRGDVTKTHERWRAPGIEAGFPSPALAEGVLYVIDNSANLFALDATSGAVLWQHSLGTVGKGSPVLADGKLYATEVNGRFHILKVSRAGVEPLDVDQIAIEAEGAHHAEIYASPAVAYGRIYLATEAGLYCIGDPARPFARESVPQPGAARAAAAGEGPAAAIAIHPAEVLLAPGGSARLTLRGFDARGRSVAPPAAGSWSIAGVKGKVDSAGSLTLDADGGIQTGAVEVKAGELAARARVRVFPPLPWSFDFEDLAAGQTPPSWIGAQGRFVGVKQDGNAALTHAPRERGLNRTTTFFGPSTLGNYTIEADVMSGQQGRKRADIGLIAAGYTLDLQGVHQQLEIRSWAAEMERLSKQVPFAWEPDTWYHLKLRVDLAGGKAAIRGKVWPRGAAEPEAWTIAVDDPVPTTAGSPGLTTYTPVAATYDNIKVTVNR